MGMFFSIITLFFLLCQGYLTHQSVHVCVQVVALVAVTSDMISPLQPEDIPNVLSGFIEFLHQSRGSLCKDLATANLLSEELKTKILQALSVYLEFQG